MVDVAKYWRRHGSAAVSLLSGALVLWLALHCEGGDWFISEGNADVLFTAVRRFHELPFFSFVFGGGTYFIQDPQSSLFSAATPLVLLAGPTVGLRLMEGVWGAVGCYAFIVWMRRHVGETAAQFGALAWCTSLGVFWRVAIGNDMFLWHLGLPILLLLLENLVTRQSFRSGVALGLALGIFLLGPTFHTFTYLLVPVLPIFGILTLILERPTPAAFGRIAALLAGALALGLLIASPKFACWTRFPMGRPTPDPGGPALSDALRALVDYTYTSWAKIPMGVPSATRAPGWGIEESAVALAPPATLLVPVGAVMGLLTRRYRAYAGFALVLIALSLIITSSAFVWELFRHLTHGNFRVAPRYLALAWFGMALLATLGADALFTRWQSARVPLAAAFFSGVVASALWWTHAAGQVQSRLSGDTVMPAAIDPLATARAELDSALGIDTFNALVWFNEKAPRRALLEGMGLSNGYFVVGNERNHRRWFSTRPIPLADGLPIADVGAQHTLLELSNVPVGVPLLLRVMKPRFGFTLQTSPANTKLSLEWTREGLLLTNQGPEVLDIFEMRPAFPISGAWFFLSATALLGACAALTCFRGARFPAALRRFTFSV